MIYYGKELYHYGIKGQKHGIRNYQNPDGSYTDKGQQENNGHGRYYDPKDNNKKSNKYLKAGLIIAGTVLAAYGGYKLYQNRQMIKNYMNLGYKNVKFIRKSGAVDYLDIDNVKGIIEDSGFKQIIDNEQTVEMLQKVNPDGTHNICYNCVCATVGRLFGLDIQASDNIKDLSYHELLENAFGINSFSELIKPITNPTNDKVRNNLLRRGKIGDVGIIGVTWNDTYKDFYKSVMGVEPESLGHVFNYLIKSDEKGNKILEFLDGEAGKGDTKIQAHLEKYLDNNIEALVCKIGNIVDENTEDFVNRMANTKFKGFVK